MWPKKKCYHVNPPPPKKNNRFLIFGRHVGPSGGGVSDDTDLSLITIFAARPGDPEGSAGQFIHDLRAELPRLRGLGPSTRAAVGLEPGSADGFAIVGPTVIGNTNGGVMRTALLGLGFSSGDDARRRALVSAMASVTHPAKPATQCAVLASALHSRAFEAGRLNAADVIVDESAALGTLEASVDEWVSEVRTWSPPARGISMDPVETLAAVVWVVDRSESLPDAYRLSCDLGGDTDTVAALAGGLVAARSGPAGVVEIAWIDDVLWFEIPQVVLAAQRLSEIRATSP